jgi:Phospholipid methyltransferase
MVRPQVRSGCAVFSVGFVLAIWAITTIRRAGTRVETNKPTTAIVENGPYRFTRATRSTSVCSLFYFVIRFSVIARQV